jgi:hypothetical protein
LRVLRRIFGLQREKVAVGWRRLRNEELHNLYISPYVSLAIKSGRMRLAGNVARMVEMRNACNILVGKTEEKRPFRGPRCIWEDNIRMYLREIGWGCVVWMHLGQDRDQ